MAIGTTLIYIYYVSMILDYGAIVWLTCLGGCQAAGVPSELRSLMDLWYPLEAS